MPNNYYKLRLPIIMSFYVLCIVFCISNAMAQDEWAQGEDTSVNLEKVIPSAPNDAGALNQEGMMPDDGLETDDAFGVSKQNNYSEGLIKKIGYITVDFKDADIKNVLRIISYKANVNIVPSPEVTGFVTIRLQDVHWKNALEAILKTYGFGYDIQENIILVAPLDKLTTLKKMEQDLAQVQPTVTEVFQLKYVDAQDAKKAIEMQLSPRGKVTILEMTGQSGWEFGGTELGKRKRTAEEKMSRSKVIIISDVPPVMDKIRNIIEKIDTKPKQVLIEAKIMEVNADLLRDLGVDFGLDQGGATASTTPATETAKYNDNRDPLYELGGRSLGSEVEPSVFNPLSEIAGTEPYAAGLEVVFRRLLGPQFEVIIHALEENVDTNTLSAPRILTIDNQEANILIGRRYPIIKSEASTYSSSVVVTSLDYYQDVGIQLNVVPQVGADNFINMVIHPVVSSYVTATANYPVIDTREAETRVLMKDGETVMIGGLLKDVKSKSTIGVPFLSKIPILGFLFKRDTYDTGKIDLLVFITAHIIKDNELSNAEFARMQEQFSDKIAKKKKKNKK